MPIALNAKVCVSGGQQEEKSQRSQERNGDTTGSKKLARVEPDNSIRPQASILIGDQSLAQARYLYASLTSQTSVLLAASGRAQTSPRQQQREQQASRPQQQSEAKQISPGRSTAGLMQRKQAQFVLRQQELERDRALRTRRDQLEAKTSASQPAEEPSDESSGEEERSRGKSPDKRQNLSSLNRSADEFKQMPSIAVDTQWEGTNKSAGRPSLSTQNSIGSAGSDLRVNSSCLDPAMHALRAQGADLDTGNGNFIMANRRRRSVHQVQLHQQIQLQQHQQLGQQQPAILKAQMTLASLHHPSSILKVASKRIPLVSNRLGLKQQQQHHHQQQQQREQLISEEAPGGSWELAPARSLRAASSIDEASRQVQAAQDLSLSRPRFVSEPAKYFEEQQEQAALTGRFPVAWFGPEALGGPSPSPTMKIVSSCANISKGQLDESLESPSQHSVGRGSDHSYKSRGTESPQTSSPVSPLPDSGTRRSRTYRLSDEICYDLDELESPVGLLANLYEWNYPIFELSSECGDSILSKLSYRIFLDSGFFDSK